MGKFKDLTDQRFGRLLVLERTNQKNHGYIIWKCKCDCGNSFLGSSQRLLNGNLKSCGCLRKEISKENLLIGAKKKYKEIFGKVFTRWTVIGKPERKGSDYYCLCRCSCGVIKKIKKASLFSGSSKSCGCYNLDIVRTFKKEKHQQWKGGISEHPLAIKLKKMKERCYNPNAKGFKYYGKKGIKICDEWLNDVWAFIEWAKNSGYREELSIDRVDPRGNYEPSNCQWLTVSENSKKRWSDKKC